MNNIKPNSNHCLNSSFLGGKEVDIKDTSSSELFKSCQSLPKDSGGLTASFLGLVSEKEKAELEQKSLIKRNASQMAPGTTYYARAKTLYQATCLMQKAFDEAKNNGTRYVTAGVCLAGGLANLLAGNLVFGGIEMAAAVIEFKKMLSAQNVDITKIFSDIQGSVDMIKTLEEANQKSYDVIDSNLDLANEGLKEINKRMEKIDQISDLGMQDVEQAKAKAIKASNLSKAQYAQAYTKLTQSQKLMGKAMAEYEASLAAFQIALNRATNSESQDLNTTLVILKGCAKIALDKGESAQKKLAQAYALQTEGLNELKEANKKGNESAELYGEACAKAQKALFEINLQAEKEKGEATQNYLANAKREVFKVKNRGEKIKQLADLVNEDAEEGKKAAQNKGFGYASILLGGIPGAAIGGAIGANIGGAVGLAAGTKAFHERKSLLSWFGQKLFGVEQKAPEVVYQSTNKAVSFAFDAESTGSFGVLRGKSSKTKGTLTLKLGLDASPYQIEVNFNNKGGYAITKSELFKLQKTLLDRLEMQQITKKQAKFIIEQIETIQITRSNGNKQKLIPSSGNVFFALVKETIN